MGRVPQETQCWLGCVAAVKRCSPSHAVCAVPRLPLIARGTVSIKRETANEHPRGRPVHILISYPSTDSTAAAADICARLMGFYGKDAVHLDGVENSGPDTSLQAILILLIGPRWLGPVVSGRPAIHDTSDPIRRQIEFALQNGLAIVTVMVDGSPSPRAADLPESIRDLVSRQAVELSAGPHFSQSIERLRAAIDRHLQSKPWADLGPMPPSPATPVAAPIKSMAWSNGPKAHLVLLCHKFHLWVLRMRRMQCGHR
jgi:hypothetical protein